MRKRSLLTVAMALGVLALVACNGGEDPVGPTPTTAGELNEPTPNAAEEPAEPTPTPAKDALPALEISFYQGGDSFEGETALLSDVVGQGKPVVLNFWAALCPPCRIEIPDFQRVHEAREAEVTVLGLDIGPQQFLGTRDQGRELLAELGVEYPAGTTFSETVVRDYEILSMPTTVFIAADGSVFRTWSGLLTEEKLNEIIDELIAV